MVDHNTAIPMYAQIAQQISEHIVQGKYSIGEKLPSESNMCKDFGVSRTTVRQALSLLMQKNLVVSVHGKGSFVKTPDVNQSLDKIISFNSMLKLKGLIGHTTVHSFQIISLNSEAQDFLNCKVSNLTLIGHISNKPAVYYSSFFGLELGQKMYEAAQQMEYSECAFSIHDLYSVVNILPFRIEQTISAVNANPDLANILKTPVKYALLALKSHYYLADGTPLEYRLGYYNSDIYSFDLQRQV